MVSTAMSKKDREKRRKRPLYPKTRRVSIKDLVTSREFLLSIYFFGVFQVAMIMITYSASSAYPERWVYGGVGVGLAITINALVVAKKRQDSKFKAEPLNVGKILVTTGLLYMAIFSVSTLFVIMDWTIPEQGNQVSINAILNQHFFAMAFLVVIVAPVIEEIVFREFLPHAGGPSYAAFAIASLLFVALHAPAGIMGWVMYSMMASAFLYLRLNGNNMFTSIVGHIFYNSLSVVLPLILAQFA